MFTIFGYAIKIHDQSKKDLFFSPIPKSDRKSSSKLKQQQGKFRLDFR